MRGGGGGAPLPGARGRFSVCGGGPLGGWFMSWSGGGPLVGGWLMRGAGGGPLAGSWPMSGVGWGAIVGGWLMRGAGGGPVRKTCRHSCDYINVCVRGTNVNPFTPRDYHTTAMRKRMQQA